MPENTESEGQGRIGSGHGRSAMTINKELQANKTRIGSAKYYDIASALMGKGKADLEELFLNAARVSLRFNRVCVWGKIACFFRCASNFAKKECFYIYLSFQFALYVSFFGFIRFYVVHNNS